MSAQTQRTCPTCGNELAGAVYFMGKTFPVINDFTLYRGTFRSEFYTVCEMTFPGSARCFRSSSFALKKRFNAK